MDLGVIQSKIGAGEYEVSRHAEVEREHDNLSLAQVKEAIQNGRIIEQNPDTGRGESCLVAGMSGTTPVHVVCGMRGANVVLITIYIPSLPKFVDPFTRAGKSGGP